MRGLKTLLLGNSLRWNFIGNLVGRIWLGGMNLLMLPVFVHLLGAEAFGLVSLVATLQTFLGLLDLGLAGTANREVATLRGAGRQNEIPDVVRTFEVIYWVLALMIGTGIGALSGWIAYSWVPKQALPQGDIRMAVILGGVALAARWPVALYTGVLQGLERQTLQNALLIAAATTRMTITAAALVLISPTVDCFLVAQGLANMLEVFLSGTVAHRLIRASGRGRFNPAVLRRVWRFALGFNLVGAAGSLTAGTDKLMLSKLLPLVELTYYSVASTATGALQLIYLAAQTSLFPRMSICWQQRDLAQMRRLYLTGLRCTMFCCTGPVVLLFFFPAEILGLWTRSPELSDHARPLLPILAVAILGNCAHAAPLNVLLAAGRTRVPLIVNATSLPLMLVGCWWAIGGWGVMGAAMCWLLLNLICFSIYGQYCFRTVFRDGPRPLLWGVPLTCVLFAASAGFAAKSLLPAQPGTFLLLSWLFWTVVLVYAAGLLVLGEDERLTILSPLRECVARMRELCCGSKAKTTAVRS